MVTRLTNVTSREPARSSQGKSNNFAEISIEGQVLLLRQAISLLFMLTRVPSAPQTSIFNSIVDEISTDTPNPSLSLTTEKELLGVFTLFASTSDDPMKVTAVCIEQIGETQCARHVLKIAANHGDLTAVQKGLEDIIAASNVNLIQGSPASNNGHSSTVLPDRGHRAIALDDLLRKVVAFDFNRILCRLRSYHAKSAGQHKKSKMNRTPIVTQIADVFNERKNTTMHVLESHINHLVRLFSQLEITPKVEVRNPPKAAMTIVLDIVMLFHKIWQEKHCETVFGDRHLITTLKKLARYTSAAKYLISDKFARPVLATLKVEIVKLLPLGIRPYQSASGRLLPFINEIPISKSAQENLLYRSQIILNNKQSTFSEQIFANLINTKCAVHAEIQLLFYYELNSHLRSPRLIYSTKKPCFVCTLFVKCHGKHQMPESHGKLYEKWTLPATFDPLSKSGRVAMDRMVQSFIHALFAAIEVAALKTNTGKVASMESLFPRSALWARMSRAASLQRFVSEHISNPISITSMNHRLTKTGVTLARAWRLSTSMLVDKHKAHLTLSRGQPIVFEQDLNPHQPVSVRAGKISLTFTHTNSPNNISNSDRRDNHSYTKPPRMLIKLLRLATTKSQYNDDLQPRKPKPMADVSDLKPGEEVTVEQGMNGIQLIYRGERLLIHTQRRCLVPAEK